MLFPETERSVMDLVFTKGESSAFDPLDLNRFQTETRGLASVQIEREKEEQRQKIIKSGLITAAGIIGLLLYTRSVRK